MLTLPADERAQLDGAPAQPGDDAGALSALPYHAATPAADEVPADELHVGQYL
jgi:hypothetical protein